VRELGRQSAPLTEGDIRSLQALVVQRSCPDLAGSYTDLNRHVRTETSQHVFPSPAAIPSLMSDFAASLSAAPGTHPAAFAAH